MKRVLLKMEHFKPRLFFVIGLLFALPFVSSSGCSTGPDYEETEALANTAWRLDYIQAEEGKVFPDHESSSWEPPLEEYYHIHFIEKDSAKVVNRCDPPVSGNYYVTSTDSIDIVIDRDFIPRGGWKCSRALEIMGMIEDAATYSRGKETLQLSVKGFDATQPSEKSWAKSLLSFSRVTENEN
ncbi:hypothetical protein QLX67_10565 [Balneolaceae bacterium ANBcel3]|nr:hypothetical protein [Balneolaceae bacterium ANBcel3]